MKISSVSNKPVAADSPDSSRENPVGSDPGWFSLQLDPDLPNATTYELSDLLKYHDRKFVLNAYSAITKQLPGSSELAQTLQDLRGGRRSKTEIVEDLVAKYPQVHVRGLSSAWRRKVSQWPVIGYVLRVTAAIGRLPVLLRHQQQFESYVYGQQQRMADYLNHSVRSTTLAGPQLSMPDDDLGENIGDAIKTLMMLSDSLIELSAQVSEGERQLQTLQAQQGNAEAEFRAGIAALTEQLRTSFQQLQSQHEKSEAQLHADLVALTNEISTQQQHLADLQRDPQSATAHSRFLVEEQRVLVEAQRTAVNDLQEQLTDLARQQETKRGELEAKLEEIRLVVDEFRQARK